MELALAKIPRSRLMLIPASDQTAGHGTTGQAKWWEKWAHLFNLHRV